MESNENIKAMSVKKDGKFICSQSNEPLFIDEILLLKITEAERDFYLGLKNNA